MGGKAKTIEPRRLYQQIADQIRDLIESGEFQLGARLPAERDLAQRLGVSRPSLREALIALEIDNSVEIRMGSGIYVTAEPMQTTRKTGSLGDSPSELMQARIVIEGSVALLAAARMQPDALASVEMILQSMEHAIGTGKNPIDQDRDFHVAIASNCGNAVLAQIVANLFHERHSPISSKLQQRFGTAQAWCLALLEHRAIFEALSVGDGLLTQSHMHIHLENSRRRWIENESIESADLSAPMVPTSAVRTSETQ